VDTNSLYFKPTQDYWYSFVGLNYKLGKIILSHCNDRILQLLDT